MSLVFSGICSHGPGITGRAERADAALRDAFYAQLELEITTVITGWIPMVDYSGLLIFDYEFFSPNW